MPFGNNSNPETQSYLARFKSMRWLVAIMFLVLLVLVDQFRFHGYYTRQASRALEHTISMFTR